LKKTFGGFNMNLNCDVVVESEVPVKCDTYAGNENFESHESSLIPVFLSIKLHRNIMETCLFGKKNASISMTNELMDLELYA
jgi:hypothetical protein